MNPFTLLLFPSGTIITNAQITTKKISQMSLDDYENQKFGHVVRVESKENILTVHGYCKRKGSNESQESDFCIKKNPRYKKIEVVLDKHQV